MLDRPDPYFSEGAGGARLRSCMAKIGDLGTARFLKPHSQAQLSKVSQLTKAPGTVDFMPPEVMFDNPQYGTPLDVFSFACVCLHTVTQKWPSPTAPVYTDPKTNVLQPRSEAERRELLLDMIYNEAFILKPLLLDCLENNPDSRPSIVEVSKKLENFKDSNCQLPMPNLLKTSDETDYGISQLQLYSNKAAFDWESLEKIWQQCADLPMPAKQIRSITQIDGKVYVTDYGSCVFCYSSSEDSWSTLPTLPIKAYCLACIVPTKQLMAIGGVSKIGISNRALLWDGRCWRDDIITSKMAIPRYSGSAVSFQSSVIVIGGRIDSQQSTTQSVEVLLIDPENLSASHWQTIQSIPFGTNSPMTVVINDMLYVVGGFMLGAAVSFMTCASIPILLSSNSSTSNVWSEVTNLPCTTASFTSYKDHFLVFGGDYIQCIRGHKRVWKAVPSIYLYHSQKKQWEVVDQSPYDYYFGRCVNLTPSKIMFFGGQPDVSVCSFSGQCHILTLVDRRTSTYQEF